MLSPRQQYSPTSAMRCFMQCDVKYFLWQTLTSLPWWEQNANTPCPCLQKNSHLSLVNTWRYTLNFKIGNPKRTSTELLLTFLHFFNRLQPSETYILRKWKYEILPEPSSQFLINDHSCGEVFKKRTAKYVNREIKKNAETVQIRK